jgi:hypothetical protein
LAVLVRSALREGELPEKEDFIWETLGFLSMGIPIGRDAVRLAEGRLGGKGFSSPRMGGSVGYAGIENTINAAIDIGKALSADTRKQRDKAQMRAIKEFVNAVGFWVGLPTPQLWRSIEGSKAYFVDDKGGPLAPLLGKPLKDGR